MLPLRQARSPGLRIVPSLPVWRWRWRLWARVGFWARFVWWALRTRLRFGVRFWLWSGGRPWRRRRLYTRDRSHDGISKTIQVPVYRFCGRGEISADEYDRTCRNQAAGSRKIRSSHKVRLQDARRTMKGFAATFAMNRPCYRFSGYRKDTGSDEILFGLFSFLNLNSWRATLATSFGSSVWTK